MKFQPNFVPFQFMKATSGLLVGKVLLLCVRLAYYEVATPIKDMHQRTLNHYTQLHIALISNYIYLTMYCIQNSVRKTIVDIKQAVAVRGD